MPVQVSLLMITLTSMVRTLVAGYAKTLIPHMLSLYLQEGWVSEHPLCTQRASLGNQDSDCHTVSAHDCDS